MTSTILATTSASITDLKRNPMGTVAAGAGDPVVILNRNRPAFYCLPPEVYEEMIEVLDDLELARIIEERKDEEVIEVSLNDL